MKRWPLLTVAISSFVLAPLLPAADWPQFRHDARHSAASPDSLPDELHLAWVKELLPPQPAFPKGGISGLTRPSRRLPDCSAT